MADGENSTEDIEREGPGESQDQLTRWHALYRRRSAAYLPDLTDDEEIELWSLTVDNLSSIATAWFHADPSGVNWEILHFVSLAIKSSIDGKPPKAWRPSGGRKKGVLWECALCIAAAYIRLCKEGLIEDDDYNRTVRQLYVVDSSTVQDWSSFDKARYAEEYEGMKEHIMDKDGLARMNMPAAAARRELGRKFLANAARQYRRDGF